MLSRRHIRIKVFQAIYEFSQNPDGDLGKGEKKLVQSIHKIYELFLYELKVLVDMLRLAEDIIEQRRNKKLPTQEDLSPSLKFINNSFLKWLQSNDNFVKEVEARKVSWGDDRELIRNILKEFQASEEFKAYLESVEEGVEADKRIIKQLYGKWITQSDALHQWYEDKDMHWSDDLDAAQMMVTKTIKSGNGEGDYQMPKLLKDNEDMDFAKTLYFKSISKGGDYEKMIHAKAQNWEMDRIATLDIILMKMALAELESFKEIPVKVTLNEYIELSKEYSTPKSGNFINGILDKIKAEMLDSGEIRKIGRGLL